MRYLRYLPILAVLAACSSRKAETPHSFRVYEEDGIVISVTAGSPKYEGELFEYIPVVTLEEDERPESLLYRPSDFLMDSQGRLEV